VLLERLALGLIVHGPTVATLRAVRPLARSPLWLETRNLLREHGFTEEDISYLMGAHARGCPCWECLRALNRAVRRAHQRRRHQSTI